MLGGDSGSHFFQRITVITADQFIDFLQFLFYEPMGQRVAFHYAVPQKNIDRSFF
jgi:hypothetical protein